VNQRSLLVMGNIPSGKGCPFLDECKIWEWNNRCPTWVKPNMTEYSCAMARALDLIYQEGEK